jgi:hypothetical protein
MFLASGVCWKVHCMIDLDQAPAKGETHGPVDGWLDPFNPRWVLNTAKAW